MNTHTTLIAGSNPNEDVCFDKYPTEYRAEYLDPPYMFQPRPSYTGLASTIQYNETFELNLELPGSAPSDNLTVVLMDLG